MISTPPRKSCGATGCRWLHVAGPRREHGRRCWPTQATAGRHAGATGRSTAPPREQLRRSRRRRSATPGVPRHQGRSDHHAHGRSTHLRRQLDGLALSTRRPDRHIIVAIGDSAVADTVAAAYSSAHVVELHYSDGPLPVAQGRNTGADAAVAAGADLLVVWMSPVSPLAG
jgi:hypothetical protein